MKYILNTILEFLFWNIKYWKNIDRVWILSWKKLKLSLVKHKYKKFVFVLFCLLSFSCLFQPPLICAEEGDIASDKITSTLQDIAKLDKNDLSTVLSAYGVPQGGSQFSFWNIVGSLIFGGIGFYAFIYGKKNSLWKPMVIGIILMIYPYFISSTLLIYIVGIALTAALFYWRD